jgi:hypothetical protein
MEFEDMKKIWDSQNNEPLFAINEKALHNRILSKKKSARHIANFSELLLIGVNMVAGLFILAIGLFKLSNNVFWYLMSAWMGGTAVYLMMGRARRKKGENRFDNNMLGDLSHAIANATYQVRLSGIMRWNIIPLAILLLFGFWENDKSSFWVIILVLLFLFITHFASGWEHGIYKARKRELEVLQKKLEAED